MADKPEKQSKFKAFFLRIPKFFRDQRSEMKKIVWPTRKQVMNNTGIVLAAIVIFAVAVGSFDWILGVLVRTLLGA